MVGGMGAVQLVLTAGRGRCRVSGAVQTARCSHASWPAFNSSTGGAISMQAMMHDCIRLLCTQKHLQLQACCHPALPQAVRGCCPSAFCTPGCVWGGVRCAAVTHRPVQVAAKAVLLHLTRAKLREAVGDATTDGFALWHRAQQATQPGRHSQTHGQHRHGFNDVLTQTQAYMNTPRQAEQHVQAAGKQPQHNSCCSQPCKEWCPKPL